MPDFHESFSTALTTDPFRPFVVRTHDGRAITVNNPGDALLNSQAISMCGPDFSLTVIGLHQIREIAEV